MARSRKRPGAVTGAGRHSKGFVQPQSRKAKAETDEEESKRRGGGSPRRTGARSKQELVAPVLVQRQVHHFGRRHPGGLRGNSSPELCLVCAVQLLHRRVLPGGQALYHAAARMCTPAGGEKWSKGQAECQRKTQKVKRAAKLFAPQLPTCENAATFFFSLWPTALLFSCAENFSSNLKVLQSTLN